MNLFGFSGRTSQVEYWRSARIPFLYLPIAAMIVYGVVTLGVLRWSSLALLIVFHVGALVHLAASPRWMAVTARRLHDTGLSTRWLLPYAIIVGVWALVIFWSVHTLTGAVRPDGFNELGFVLVVILLSGLWVLVGLAYSIILLALCSQRGTRGSNRYGPEPRMRD